MNAVAPTHSAVKSEQERQPPATTVRERTEHGRHDRVEPDADDDPEAQQEVAVALAELARRR